MLYWLAFFYTLAISLQCVLFPTTSNITMCAASVLGSVIAAPLLIDTNNWRKTPISTSSIAGYTAYYFILPPCVMLLEGSAVTHNLESPESLAIQSLLFLCSLATGHFIYRRTEFAKQWGRGYLQLFLRKTGAFENFSTQQIITIGMIGVGASAFFAYRRATHDAPNLGPMLQLLLAVSTFAVIPLTLVIPSAFGIKGGSFHSRFFLPATWLCGIGLVAILRNNRTALFAGISSVLIVFAWRQITTSRSRLPLKKQVAILVLLATSYMVVGALSNLVLAMELARDHRGKQSALATASLTVQALIDTQQLKEFKAKKLLTSGTQDAFDESYCENPMFARLCNLRFADRALTLADQIPPSGKAEYTKFEADRIYAILPAPVLSLLPIEINKQNAIAGSGGDQIVFLSTGNPTAIGGFRTGSLIASASICFGWMLPFAVTALSIPVFSLMDSLFSKANQTYSPLCLALLFEFAFFWTSAATGCETLSSVCAFIVRGWLETSLLFAAASFAARQLPRFTISWNTRARICAK